MDWIFIWMTIITFTFLLEVITKDFVIIFYCLGAFICLFLNALHVSTDMQIWFFLIFSSISMLGLHREARYYYAFFKERRNSGDLLGLEGIVTKDIKKDSIGHVKVKVGIWKAASDEDINKGEKIIVVKQKDMTLIVRKENK